MAVCWIASATTFQSCRARTKRVGVQRWRGSSAERWQNICAYPWLARQKSPFLSPFAKAIMRELTPIRLWGYKMQKNVGRLWDMLHFYAEHFLSINRGIVYAREEFKFPPHTFTPEEQTNHDYSPVPADFREKLVGPFNNIRESCDAIGLTLTVDQ